MTMDDYLAARPVSTPFGLLDCDVPVDGSIAFVVSPADYAPRLPEPAGTGRGDRRRGAAPAAGSTGPTTRRWRRSRPPPSCWSRTDLHPSDVDVAELYDGFTFLTFAWLEALGLCGDGEAGPFVEGGARIALDGDLPLNTYGGQLSAGRMHGYWVLHEACLQLRGDAGARQVQRPPGGRRRRRSAAAPSPAACCSRGKLWTREWVWHGACSLGARGAVFPKLASSVLPER